MREFFILYIFLKIFLKVGFAMNIQVDDQLHLKKKHPCGSHIWLVLRVGMDFKLRCEGCNHELMIPRSKIEKSIKKIIRDGETLCQ